LKKYVRDYANLFLMVGGIVLLDQLTKYIVRANLQYGEIYPQNHWITQYARFINWRNSGSVGGILPDSGFIFIALPIAAAVVILFFYPRTKPHERFMRLGMGFMLGGALGNMIDRIYQGYVTDFLSIFSLPMVLNVADISLFLGILTLSYAIWQSEKQSQLEKIQAEAVDKEKSPKQETPLQDPIESSNDE